MRRTPLVSGLLVLAAAWFAVPHRSLGPFAAHMTAHIAVVALAAPLLAAAVIGGRLDPASRAPRVFSPVVASIVELVLVWAWHVPAAHVAARSSMLVLAAEQATFLAAGLFLWIAAAGGDGRHGAARGAAGTAALLFTSMHMTLLGALFAMAPRVLYAHAHGDPASALDDQHLGGVIMLLVGGGSYLAGGLWLTRRVLRVPAAATTTIAILLALVSAGCGASREGNAGLVSGGDPARGADVIRARDCGGCHRIPGIVGAEGLVAAPLDMMARRMYIAGRLPNDPESLARFIRAPEDVDPNTAMPNLGLSDQQARDVTAYLYTLR